MSRSHHHVKVGRNWRHRRRFMIRASVKAKRRKQRQRLARHLQAPRPADLEVLADREEQAGRLAYAEVLRRDASWPT